jgi:hypothetical protein
LHKIEKHGKNRVWKGKIYKNLSVTIQLEKEVFDKKRSDTVFCQKERGISLSRSQEPNWKDSTKNSS